MNYPVGATSVPMVRGWRGVVATDNEKRTALGIGWECPHQHMYRDTADNCAGRAYRRWDRTGEKPE